MYASLAGQVIGAGMQAGGAFMGANQADKRRNQLLHIAETPGVDFGDITADALSSMAENLPAASKLSKDSAFAQQSTIDAILERIIPGYSAMQKQRAGNAAALLRGEIPQDVSSRVTRNAAERAVAGGFGGSRFGTNLTLRDLGLTSLDAMGTGARMFQDQITGTPTAKVVEPLDLSGISPQAAINLREGERVDKMNRLTTWAGAPSGRDVWGKFLTDTGSQISGAASSGAFKGMGGMGGKS